MKIFNFKKEKRPDRTNSYLGGFTLLEALVAVSILMVAVVAPITISQKGLSSAVYTKDHMLASYLAQDAIEYIKNQRDFITINNMNDWGNLTLSNKFSPCLPNSVGNKQYCQIDTVGGANNEGEIKPNSNSKMYIDSNGFYGYTTTSTSTDFIRKVSMTPDPKGTGLNDEILVEVVVSWKNNIDYEIELYSLIYNY